MTAVKGVNSILDVVPSMQGNERNKPANGGFEDVWKQQSGKETTSRSSEFPARKSMKDSVRAREEHTVRTSQTKTERVGKEERFFSEEERENAAEVLNQAAVELVEQIAQILQIPVEEMESAMRELELEPVDLLNPVNRNQLFFQMEQVQDPSELILNEELYETYQQMVEVGEKKIESLAETLQLPVNQLEELVGQLRNQDFSEKLGQAANLSEQEMPLPVKKKEALEEQEKGQLWKLQGTLESSDTVEETGTENVQMARPQEERTMSFETVKEEMAAEETETEEKPSAKEIPEKKISRTEEVSKGNWNGVLEVREQENQVTGQQAVSGRTSPWDESTQNIMRQILDYMKVSVSSESSNLEMQLHPASLGTLQVNVSSKGGVITANFITQNEAVKSALESQLVQLKESFEEQGVKVNAIEVTVQTHSFEQNLEQGRGGNQNQDARRTANRTRRFRVDASMFVEEETENSGAGVVDATGSTVNFTA